jgi:hypothetical protein
MKLKDLLEISGQGFTTKQTSFDKDTGKIGWDVEYFPDFSEILDSIDSTSKALEKTIHDYSIQDEEIATSLKGLKAIKSILLKTLEKNHPDYIKDYHSKK